MLTILSIFFWVGLVGGILALVAFLLGRFFYGPPRPDAVHFIESTDGWRIGLGRYLPASPLPEATPIVLCPGFGFSASIFDLSEEISLARFLAVQGYDVWTLDLRGRGFSDKPRLWGNIRFNWSFDDYADFDVPAAVDRICQLTGAQGVQWIGLDMGALALWAAAGGGKVSNIKSVIALGAAAFFKRQRPHLPTNLLRLLSFLRLEAMAALLSPIWGHLYPPPLGTLQNRDNIDDATYRRALVNGGCSFSRKEMTQYRQWLEEDCFQSSDQLRDFRAALATLNIPTLFVCGVRDLLGPVDMVESTSQAMTQLQQKDTLLVSRMHGMSANYGHLDLLIGRNAHRDIFPHLLEWLDLHAGIPLEGRPGAAAGPGHDQEPRPAPQRRVPSPVQKPAVAPPQANGSDDLSDPGFETDSLDESWTPPSSAELLARAATQHSPAQSLPHRDADQGQDFQQRGSAASPVAAEDQSVAPKSEPGRPRGDEPARPAAAPTTEELMEELKGEEDGEDDTEEDGEDDLDWMDGDVPHVPARERE